MHERLQKILARAGLGSRREMEQWIQDGRVKVNGKVATLGQKVEPKQVIRVDGKLVQSQFLAQKDPRVIVYNKPEGEICSTRDPEHKNTVFDRLPTLKQGKWIAVGRLDINTAGLLLFTTDGELAHRLMHPSWEQVREYAVRVFGEVSEDDLKTLQAGIVLDGKKANFDHIRVLPGEGINRWFTVTLKEGRNREVRRMWESLGYKVSRLTRVRFGIMELPRDLKRGVWLELQGSDINALRKSVELPTHRFTFNKKAAEKIQRDKKKRKFNRF